MLQILFILGAMYNYRASLENKVDPRCYLYEYLKVWIYFTDKGISVDQYDRALDAVRRQMDRSALTRRALRAGIIDYADIPVNEDYINEIEAQGGLLIHRSKWLNAASFWIDQDALTEIANLDFIHKITRVASLQSPNDTEVAIEDTAIYGLAYRQLKMFNIDQVHELGIFGSNVKVGILDTGLRRKHTALRNVNVIAEYDFLGGDQVFAENIPATEQYGTYSDIVFHKTSSRLNIFYSCDTLKNNLPVRDIMYTYSIDQGNTWLPIIKITDNFNNNWVNELDVCGNDNTMFIFYRDRYGLRYLVYTDTLLIPSTPLAGFSYREPSAVQINDTVYVVYHDTTDFLFLNKGNISGFIGETIIDSSVSNIKAPKIVKGDSKIGIFYHVCPEDSLYFLKSSIPETTFTRQFINIGKDAAAISAGDTIFLVWKDTSYDPLFRIAFRKSNDFGTSFTTPLYLSEYVNAIGKISIAKFNDKITIAWETAGKIYFKISYNNGNSFGTLDSLNKEFVYLPTLGIAASDIIKIYCSRGDSVTDGYAPNAPHYDSPRHGTEMLGLIGGYFSGQYIGVAPGVQFLVAKTEDIDYEFPVEEDTWIAGLEWFESKGADIASSSLGYADWYTWPVDFDGKTSPASIAAYEATKRGMIITTAAGNISNMHLSNPRIVMPGDAEGVITVGGIDSLYNHWKSPNVFSGYFPTADHSVKKPEIVCLSAAPVVVDPDTTSSYLLSFGTSGATAMTAGICALLLDAHPNWTVDSVRNALFNTASFASTPSDSMGYGWPDVFEAIHYSPIAVDTTPGSAFLTPYPNPFIIGQHNNIYIPFKLTRESSVEIRLYSLNGRLIKKDERERLLLPGRYSDTDATSRNAAFIWDGKDAEGNDVGSGIYYCLLLTHGAGNDLVKIAVVR